MVSATGLHCNAAATPVYHEARRHHPRREPIHESRGGSVENLTGSGEPPPTLARGAVGSMAIRVAAEALNLLTSIVLARLMGVRGYGIYAYALSVITLLTIPAAAGLPTVAIREVAVYKARGEWSLMLGLGRWMTRVVLAVSLIVVSAMFVVSLVWSTRVSTEVRDTVLVGLPLVPLIALAAVQGGRLRGLHHVLLGQLPDRLLLPIFMVALIGAAAAVVGHDRLDAVAVMALQVLAATAALGVASWALAQKAPSSLRHIAPAYETKRWVRFGHTAAHS